jgi:hypothetical protein
MPTARPFARNTGAPIAGTIQVGNLAVGIPTAGFAATGLPWWNGPNEDLGYVIATQVAANNQPTPVPPSVTASVGFWRSTALTDASFIDLAQYVARIAGTPQTFVDGSAAKTWLNNNGYWTSWVVVTQIGDMAYGGKVAYILQPGDPGYDANVQHGWVISPIIGTATWNNANTAISTYTNNGFSGWFMPSYDDLRLTVNTNLSGYISDNGSGIWSSNNCLTVNPSCCCPSTQYSKWSFIFQSGYISSDNVPQQYIARRDF